MPAHKVKLGKPCCQERGYSALIADDGHWRCLTHPEAHLFCPRQCPVSRCLVGGPDGPAPAGQEVSCLHGLSPQVKLGIQMGQPQANEDGVGQARAEVMSPHDPDALSQQGLEPYTARDQTAVHPSSPAVTHLA